MQISLISWPDILINYHIIIITILLIFSTIKEINITVSFHKLLLFSYLISNCVCLIKVTAPSYREFVTTIQVVNMSEVTSNLADRSLILF